MKVREYIEVSSKLSDPKLTCVCDEILDEDVVVNCNGERFTLNGINITAEGIKNPTIFLEMKRIDTSL